MRTITPQFTNNNDRPRLILESRDLNEVVLPQYLDDFGDIQSRYNLYNYLTINNRFKFRVHKLQGHPLMWQPHKSCNLEKTGSLNFGVNEVEPDPMYLLETNCVDEMFNSDFAHYVRYQNGQLDLEADGDALLSQVVDFIAKLASLNARNLAAAGDLYDEDFVKENLIKTLPVRVLDGFHKTYRTTKGWIRTVIESANAAGNHFKGAHVANIFNDKDFTPQGDYEGSIVDIFDNLKRSASPSLRKLINKGSAAFAGVRPYRPLFVVSDAVYTALVGEYNANASLVAQNRERLTRENVGAAGDPRYQFFIDGVPVVCLEDINAYDEYFDGQTYYAGFVTSGVVNFGLSFGNLAEDVNNPNAALIVEQDWTISNGNYGQTSFSSFALMKAMISDLEYICQTSTFRKHTA